MRSQLTILLIAFLGDEKASNKLASRILNEKLTVDEDVMKLGGGSIQNILDWIPANTKVVVKTPKLNIEGGLKINKPVHITSDNGETECTCDDIVITADNVYVGGFIFNRCVKEAEQGLIHIQYAHNVFIEDITFSVCTNFAGPACISSSGSSATLSNINARESLSGSNGAFMYMYDSDITINDGTYTNSCAQGSGGAIFAENGGKLTVSGCTFRSSISDGKGGAVYIHGADSSLNVFNSVFKSNVAVFGGAIYGDMATSCVDGSIFAENEAKDRSAGAVYVWAGSLSASKNTFVSNSAGFHGGGIYVTNKGQLKVDSCTFRNNTARIWGGGIGAFDVPSLSISRSEFIENKIQRDGGGVYVQSDEFTLTDSSFISNQAAENGGGLAGVGGELTLAKVNFVNNVATSCGGGIGAFNAVMTVYSGFFINNDAGISGGGIFSKGGALVTSDDSQFINSPVVETDRTAVS